MKGKGCGLVALVVVSLFFMFVSSPAFAWFFPDPVIANPFSYDVLYGTLFDPDYTYFSGTEVAGFDSGGNVVFRSIVGAVSDDFVSSNVWADVASWRIYDPSNMYVWAAVTTDGTDWPGFQEDWSTYRVNLERFGEEPLLIAPEPTTLLALGLLAASGAGFFRIKKRRED